MGARGPVGNRSDDLARDRSRKGSDQQDVKPGTLMPVTIPDPDPDWHPIALMVWNSLATSGQSAFYQDTDWAYAYSLCDELSAYKKPLYYKDSGAEYFKRSPEMFKALLSGMTALCMTEGDRRRVRIELSAPEPEKDPASVAVMADYRKLVAVVPTDPEPETD